jgi:hypothetical protein
MGDKQFVMEIHVEALTLGSSRVSLQPTMLGRTPSFYVCGENAIVTLYSIHHDHFVGSDHMVFTMMLSIRAVSRASGTPQ